MMFVHHFQVLLVIASGMHHTWGSLNNGESTTSSPPIVDSCQDLCNSVASCAQDPRSHGSYCKSWQNPPVCFGLYTQSSGFCFAPNDITCSEAQPVLCSEVTTTESPSTETTTESPSTMSESPTESSIETPPGIV